MGSSLLLGFAGQQSVWVAESGGSSTDFGTNIDGTGFNVLYEFGGSAGAYPTCLLAGSSNRPLGATGRSGDHDLGTVFAVMSDGTGLTTL